jgi:surface polysaccharide O-acyltransferase-like enzyme
MKPLSAAPDSASCAARAPPAQRNAAIDRARSFLTVVVLIHHSVIPYTYFGHTDPARFIGFDAIVLANDSYFMAMFFFLSGLFVWPSLQRRSIAEFSRDRVLRLGLPFIVCVLTLIPLAYYAVEPRGSAESFAAFWWRTVTVGPWSSGPVWFTWVLLVFGVVAALVSRAAPDAPAPIIALSQRGFADPLAFFALFAAVTLALYVPARLVFGPSEWFEAGPIAVQSSRVLLYATYFAFGIGVGAARVGSGLISPGGALPRQWPGWSLAALVPYAAMWGLIAIKREVLGNPPEQPPWYELMYGVAFALFSAAMLFALLALFLRFKAHGRSVLDWMQPNAYGIFLVHYPFVLWIQYALHDAGLSAIAKATIALAGALGLSWATSAALRRLPGAQRVL